MSNFIIGLAFGWCLLLLIQAITSEDKEPSKYDDDNGDWF